MPTTIAQQQPTRKQSFLRNKLRESFRPSALRGLLEHSEKDEVQQEKPRKSVDGKRQSMEEQSWISRKRRKNKAAKDDEPKHVIDELKIDVGGFDDFKSTLDPGSELYSLKSPETLLSPATMTTTATTSTKETVLTLKPTQKPLMQKLNQYSPTKEQKMTFPDSHELEDTSPIAKAGDPMDIDSEPPQPQPEIRKGPKWQIKTDSLVRPVSSGKANALSANVSSTIAAINKNNFHVTNKWSAKVDNMASARPSGESNRSKMTAQTNYTDKVDSVIGSNASVTSGRQPLGSTARTNVNRNVVAQADKPPNASTEQENSKRQSIPPVAVRRQSLMDMQNKASQERPKSPTGSIASTATGAPKARRLSGTNVAARMSWLQELENKKSPGQEYMANKLQGGVADKLRRFESRNSQAEGSAARSQSATRGSDAYGIESARRLSKQVTHNDDFRKKLEEQFQRKKEADEELQRKKNNRASLPVGIGRTPQPIVDYVELNDKDREAEINELTKNGKGPENARKLDIHAKAVLAGPKQANAVFQNASAALRSTTNLLDSIKAASGTASKSTTALSRTMSVQAKPRKVSPSSKPPRPVSYAPSTATSVDDDYDPFNYAVYPSRSSMYSNPPEAPAETPATEYDEEDLIPEVEEEAEKPESPIVPDYTNPIEEGFVVKDIEEPHAVVDLSAKEPTAPIIAPVELPTVEEAPTPAPAPSTPVPAPQDASKATSGWAARFSSTPAKPSTPSALPIRVHGGADKAAAIVASATPAKSPTSAPRQEETTEIERTVSSEECVAQEAVPASPTLVDIPSSKKSTPVKERVVPEPVNAEEKPTEFIAAALPRMGAA